MVLTYRKSIILGFLLLGIVSGLFIPSLKFSFSFEQFFPQGDPDLAFFQEFISEFESDDNFLLVAIENKPTVFDTAFLEKFHQYALELQGIKHVTQVQSLTKMRSPIKTPFGVSSIPTLHRKNKTKLEQDGQLILSDPRFVNNLINEDADAMVVFVKNIDQIDVEQSHEMMEDVNALNQKYGWKDIHMLGRANLQDVLVRMQKIEIMKSSVLSVVLVSIVLFLIYGRIHGTVISLVSIGLSLMIFLGVMSMLGREFNALSALYPVLMLIVGTSDVIHIKSKYIDEIRKGLGKIDAMVVSIKEIGLATLLTSVTTSVGFLTLLTSKVQPIRDFGINAAAGVMIAYITVIFFTTSLLVMLDVDKISNNVTQQSFWDKWVRRIYLTTLHKPRRIVAISAVLIGVFFYGISIISTNYRIEKNLPRGAQITEDFQYFEKEFAGFRPLEYAITAKQNLPADSYQVLREVNKIELKLQSEEHIKSTLSMASVYKSVERMNRGNQIDGYVFPENEQDFKTSQRMIKRSKMAESSVMVSRDGTKTRISSRMNDIGADSIKLIGQRLDTWVEENVDTSIIDAKRTGTGIILDKNAVYIRDNLFQGLGLAIVVVSIVMAFLFRRLRMLFIALVPNLVPLLLAGAIIGYAGIELEAGISVVFAIIFGIAVDDTIHFLSKYALARRKGLDMEAAMSVTFSETGKAIIFTTVILFFGFLIMLFSSHPPSVTIGLLIASTLIGALICDLFLLPILMRKFL